MAKHRSLSRRRLLKWGLLSTGLSTLPGETLPAAFAQVGGRAEDALFEGKNLPGGGQLDVRLVATPFTSDADEYEIWQRLKPFNYDSWVVEYTRMAEKNEKMAEQFEKEGLKVSANEYYRRAARFYLTACFPQPDTDPRMMANFNKLLEMHKRSRQLAPPAFEIVEIPYEGNTLTGYLTKPRGNAGQRFPVVFEYGGADRITVTGGGADYNARGLAFLDVDCPGQGASLRIKRLYAPADSERVAKAVIDYLGTRADVDPNRIGIVGSSMGGYSAPRAASGEKRLKACAMWSGAYSLLQDIFDYFPPIQDRIRWLIGAKDMTDARKKIAEFTLEGRARNIECPLLIGYSKDDRIMDPNGALRLYQGAVNSQRTMVEGIGHDHPTRIGGPKSRVSERGQILADWMAKQLA